MRIRSQPGQSSIFQVVVRPTNSIFSSVLALMKTRRFIASERYSVCAAVPIVGYASLGRAWNECLQWELGGLKSYKPKDCEDIAGAIDFLLSITPEKWDDLKKQPENEKAALELSWAMDLAANYTTIYTAFCEDDK
jgi:hypothetical protein